MSKLIVANGCSFTEEYYLDRKDRWTTKCNVNINLALGGGSNERIFFTTLEYLNHNTPDVVIIGWTATQRFMLPSNNGSRIAIMPGHSFDENIGGNERKFSDFYYKNCYNEFTSLERTLNYMIHLQTVCQLKGIKLLNFNSLLPEIGEENLKSIASMAFMSRKDKDIEKMGIQHNLKKLKGLIDKLDKSTWIYEFWYSMPVHCKNFPLEKSGHPDVDGSNHWAKLVKKYL